MVCSCSPRNRTDSPCDSPRVDTWIDEIYTKLTETFRNIPSTNGKINRALESMKLIAPLARSRDKIAQKNYDLFRIICPAPPFPVPPMPARLNASSLAIYSAYNRDGPLPVVGTPNEILSYLRLAFDSVTRGHPNLDEPIQSALRALGYACNFFANWTLDDFNSAQNWFFSGLCYVYEGDKPDQFRKVALHFLPRVSNRLFRLHVLPATRNQREILCANWVHTVNSIGCLDEVQDDVVKVLLAMLDADQWRPHVIQKIWSLLESIALVPDPQPLRTCLDHPQVVAAIRGVEDRAVMAGWLAAARNHGGLAHRVQELVPERQEPEPERQGKERSGLVQELFGHLGAHLRGLLTDCGRAVGKNLGACRKPLRRFRGTHTRDAGVDDSRP